MKRSTSTLSSSTMLLVMITAFLFQFAYTQVPELSVTLELNQASAKYGLSVANAGDINGDGFDDMIVGAPYYDNGQIDEGAVFIYYGGITGIQPTPSLIIEGNIANYLMGFSVDGAGDINNDGYADIVIGVYGYTNPNISEGAAFIYFGSPAGVNLGSLTIRESNKTSAAMGCSVSTAGDVNGDNYDDIVVGSMWYGNGQNGEGRAYVYQGSASGLSATPAIILESNQVMAEFGESVSGAEDINGDGYSDIIIGCRRYDNGQSEEGRAYLYLGSATGIAATPSVILEGGIDSIYFGDVVAGIGDINGDGFAEIAVGAPSWDTAGWQLDEGKLFIYNGSAAGLITTPSATREGNSWYYRYATAITGAGDMNMDGYADFLVGCTGGNFTRLFMGSAEGPDLSSPIIMSGGTYGAYYGYSIAGGGDYNGDGYTDFAIGSPFDDNGETDEGLVYVYLGNNCDSLFYADNDNDGFGDPYSTMYACTAPEGYVTNALDCDDYYAIINPYSVWYVDMDLDQYYAGTGDPIMQCEQPGINYHIFIIGGGDCNDSVAIVNPAGVEEYDGYDNNCDGTIDEGFTATYDILLQEDQLWSYYGCSVAGGGDINGDGFMDVLVGASNYTRGQVKEGIAFVYLGTADGLNTDPHILLEQNQHHSSNGYQVDFAGDVNGDGYEDVLVSCPLYENPKKNQGRVMIYHGSPSGLNNTPNTLLEIQQGKAEFGYSAAGAGDINGDGYDDIIVGAHKFKRGQTNEGAVFVFYGSPSGIINTPIIPIEVNQEYAYFGDRVSSAGDINNDGYADFLAGCYYCSDGNPDEGLVYVYLGSAAGYITTPASILQSNIDGSRSVIVSAAGDVNGDGFDDVIIGSYGYDMAFVYYGNATGLSPDPDILTSGFIGPDYAETYVAYAGDVNNDGFSDVLVGYPNASDGFIHQGMATLHLGSADGIQALPYRTITVEQSNTEYSLAMAGVGDLNGDDLDDIIVGAPRYTYGDLREGAAFVYFIGDTIYPKLQNPNPDNLIANTSDPGSESRMLKLYPNPSVGSVTVIFEKGSRTKTLTISDLNGEVIRTENISSDVASVVLDLHNLPTGVYMLELYCGDYFYREKLIRIN